jgi:hypothetical protein
MGNHPSPPDQRVVLLKKLASKGPKVTVDEVRQMISAMTTFACEHLTGAGFDPVAIRAIATKFRDAGRRSPPWRPASGKVPGRPQDGADGNRRSRWLFGTDHKFYADEVTATLVELRYYLQMLSMQNAPPLPKDSFQDSFVWLTGHRIVPGAYVDPLQRDPIDLKKFMEDRRYVESGHIVPLDRGGRHDPSNAFLCLRDSNRIQGSLTMEELMNLMKRIIDRHEADSTKAAKASS